MDQINIPFTTKQAKVIVFMLGFLTIMPVVLDIINPISFIFMIIGTVCMIVIVFISIFDFITSREFVFKE